MDIKKAIWFSSVVRKTLTTFANMILDGRRYSIKFVDSGTGSFDRDGKQITINTTLFPKLNVKDQYRMVMAILGHEVGHAWFTEWWDPTKGTALIQMVNILEDERMEILFGKLFPRLRELIEELGTRMYKNREAAKEEDEVYAACLRWRWAYKTMTDEQFINENFTNLKNVELWLVVRRLVEAAWYCSSTLEVAVISRRILEILGIKETESQRLKNGVGDLPIGASIVSEEESHSTMSGDAGENDEHESDSKIFAKPHVDPDIIDAGVMPDFRRICKDILASDAELAPYFDISDAVAEHANQIRSVLFIKDIRPAVLHHEYRGKYSARLDMRDAERVFLLEVGRARSRSRLTVSILVDESGSMYQFNDVIRKVVMAMYIGVTSAKIPLQVVFFGQDSYIKDSNNHMARVIVDERTPPDVAMGRIAGFEAFSSYEFLYDGLRLAKAFIERVPADIHLVFVVHDGEPVYHGKYNDFNTSAEMVRDMTKAHDTKIFGIYLGRDKREVDNIGKIFPTLIQVEDVEYLPREIETVMKTLS